MTLALTILYLVISGVIYGYLENRWKEELKSDGSILAEEHSADYKSLQISITVLWLPIVALCVFLSPAYIAYKATVHLTR